MKQKKEFIEDQQILSSAIKRELHKRLGNALTEEEITSIADEFARNYDFTNRAIAHKTPAGWAKYIIEKLELNNINEPASKTDNNDVYTYVDMVYPENEKEQEDLMRIYGM